MRFVTAGLLVAALLAPAHADPVADRFEETLQAHADTGRFSGAALLARNGEVIFEGAYGCFDAECLEQNTVATIFNIGSIGKMFSQALALERVDAGVWDLDTTVAEIWPDHGLEHGGAITIEQLLTHTSGLGNYFTHPDYSLEARETDDFLALARTEEPAFTPGEGFTYSNTAFWVLARLLEITDPKGRPWRVQFEQDVFDPAGMDGVRFLQPDETHAERPQGFHRNAAGGMDARETLPRPGPDGGAYATVHDLLAFSEAVDEGAWYGESIRRRAETPWADFAALGARMGLTWELFEDRGVTYVSKGGTLLGSGGELVRFSHGGDDYTMALLANMSNAPLIIFRDVAAYTLDLEGAALPEIAESERLHNALQRGEPVLTDVSGWAVSAGVEHPAAAVSRLGRHYARTGDRARASELLAALYREFPDDPASERLAAMLSE